ncbi:hypothetical protein FHP05_04920 [Cerasibacillus terrae]|uniref:Uncharacterized protein n=1 Tax=Cerasibacillus terrae TaxID=2498845 RepID=A0A5C8NZI9_9BACI|nr:hypothetical protein [Cerasibacillus terrae]TXL66729.1 hypothetical protein FHP05_04920 [Cerasibacillus terrae]
MSLVAAGAVTATAIGIGGAPFIVGAIVGFGISTFISVGLNWEGKTGKSISKKLKDGVHSTFNTVAGWFK